MTPVATRTVVLGAALVALGGALACGSREAPPSTQEPRVATSPSASPAADAALALDAATTTTTGTATATVDAATAPAVAVRAAEPVMLERLVPVEAMLSTEREGNPGGFTSEELDRTIRARAAAVKACYQKAIQHRDLAGKIVVRLRIAPDGHVESATVAASTLRDAPTEACVVKVLKDLRFAPRGPATVTYPFIFSSG